MLFGKTLLSVLEYVHRLLVALRRKLLGLRLLCSLLLLSRLLLSL